MPPVLSVCPARPGIVPTEQAKELVTLSQTNEGAYIIRWLRQRSGVLCVQLCCIVQVANVLHATMYYTILNKRKLQ